MARITRTREALYGYFVARKRYLCNGHLTTRHYIEPGQEFINSALPPGSDIGNTRWWHARYCLDCCPIEYAPRGAE
ncbi:MAG TPA: hypothetical protein PKD84_13460 [Propionicimonas sp.]|nr:hypothetical protein [Propionicimonas sp.]